MIVWNDLTPGIIEDVLPVKGVSTLAEAHFGSLQVYDSVQTTCVNLDFNSLKACKE